MSNYIVDFQSRGTETSPTIPGKTSITLASNTIDSTSTSLTLTGKGVPNYGEIQQENFIRLMEHFASKTAPAHPTIGQLWFDTNANTLKCYDMTQQWRVSGGATYDTVPPSPAQIGQLWFNTDENILYVKVGTGEVNSRHAVYPGGWSQVFPAPIPYAGYYEYNQIATRLNRVIGAPSVYGTDPVVENNQYGWGQTDLVETFTNINTPSTFDNTKWLVLLARMRKAARHTTVAENTIPTRGFIIDGRLDKSGLTGQYSPGITFLSGGFQGRGILGMAETYQQMLDAMTDIEANRFSLNTAGIVLNTANSWSTTGTWASDRVLTVNATFANDAAAKAYFNSGGRLLFQISTTTGTGLAGAWFTLLNSNGFDSPGLGFNYSNLLNGFTGSTIKSPIGFYNLTSSLQTLQSITRGGSYGSGSFKMEARYNGTGVVSFVFTFAEDYTAGQTANKLTIALTIRSPAATVAAATPTSPALDSPVLTGPTITTSGNFTTAAAGT